MRSTVLHLVTRPFAGLLQAEIERCMDRFIDAAKRVAEAVHRDPASIHDMLLAREEVDAGQAEVFRRRFLEGRAALRAY